MMRSLIAKWFASAVLTAALLAGGLQAAVAQSNSKNVAEQVLRAGLEAQKARKHDIAVRNFTRAINSGRLARKQMTYALYRRAVSNRAQKRPAQAISDLNSALFFKGDLSSGDRIAAIEERVKAYKDAGQEPTAVATSGRQTAPSTPSSPWAASTERPQVRKPRVITAAPRRVLERVRVVEPRRPALPVTTPILAPETAVTAPKSEISSFQTRVGAAPASPGRSYVSPTVERGVGLTKRARTARPVKPAIPAKAWSRATKTQSQKSAAALPPKVVWSKPGVSRAAPPAARALTTTASVSPNLAPRTPVRSNALPASKPAPITLPVTEVKPAPVAKPTTSSSVGQFFSSVFGNDRAATPVPSNPLSTGAVRQPEIRPVIRTKDVKKPVQVAAATPVAAPVVPAPVAQPLTQPPATKPRARGPSKFEIQVAVLRSKHRAEALAKQLVVQYGSSFWNPKKARVEESAAGEDGSIYAVKFGTYDSKNDTVSACEQFKSDGLECEVFRQ